MRDFIRLYDCGDKHNWVFYGGRSCSCDRVESKPTCSVPVYRCVSCGDFDYGDNEEAAEVIATCRKMEDWL